MGRGMGRGMRRCFVLSLLIGALALAPPAFGGTANDALKTHPATRCQTPPNIDGVLDEAVWRSAAVLDGLVQSHPQPGAAPSMKTVFRILYDDESLYLAVRCHDPEPQAIVARVARRDSEEASDWVRLEIDSRLDRTSGFFFQLTAAGVMLDGTLYDERQASSDWDGVWQAEAHIDEQGWTAELRIPLKLLRFEPSDRLRFGLSVARHVSRLNETMRWPHIPPDCGLWVSKFGLLEGLSLPDRPLSLDLVPFALTRHSFGSATEVGHAPDVGMDAKLGLGGNFMLTLAVNPDFGQVEADPAVLNLSTIESYFPEKRPFFLEDMDVFRRSQFGDGLMAELFYSRRIGRAPRWPEGEDDEEELRAPAVPAIYGAVKFAGRTGSRTSVGLLQAVSSAESALFENSAGQRVSRLAEPLTSFSVLRIKQDFLDHSSAGLMATAVATPDHGTALTGGSDLRLELFGGDYHLMANSSFSWLSTERFAWHDDFTRAALERDGAFGWGGDVVMSKDGGEHLIGGTGVKYRSPSLALNDLGYQQRPDQLSPFFWIQHRRLKPLGPITRYFINANGWLNRNSDWLSLGDGFNVNLFAQFDNAWNAWAWFNMDMARCDDRETRSAGKVIVCYEKPWMGGGAGLQTDPSDLVSGAIDFLLHTNERGWGVMGSVTLRLNPHDQIQLALIPRYRRGTGLLNWLDTLEDDDGQRYLFAERQTEFWDVVVRASLTLTRDLSFQVYSQVFLAAVDNAAKVWARPSGGRIRAADLRPAEGVADEYDGTFGSWNVNAVLRWEYRPGSVIYLVYSSVLADDWERADFRFGPVLTDLVDANADHVVLVKVSYFWE
jgi:hypothetical protein